MGRISHVKVEKNPYSLGNLIWRSKIQIWKPQKHQIKGSIDHKVCEQQHVRNIHQRMVKIKNVRYARLNRWIESKAKIDVDFHHDVLLRFRVHLVCDHLVWNERSCVEHEEARGDEGTCERPWRYSYSIKIQCLRCCYWFHQSTFGATQNARHTKERVINDGTCENPQTFSYITARSSCASKRHKTNEKTTWRRVRKKHLMGTKYTQWKYGSRRSGDLRTFSVYTPLCNEVSSKDPSY